MAKLPSETREIINQLKHESLEIINEATTVEFTIFRQFGETEETLPYLDEMKSVEEQASSSFLQLSRLQLQIAQAQPSVSKDMLELLYRGIARTEIRIPALKRSVQEVKIQWNLP